MRNIGLDLLRMLAVLLVIARHLHLPQACPAVLRALAQGGWIGVDLFFVLSGFLVSSLLFREFQREGHVDTKRFLIRRAFKIYPAFWLLLVVSLIVTELLGQSPKTRQVVGEVLFLQNYLGGVWNHTWSLAVEEHFYLGLTALVAMLIQKDPADPFRRVPLVFAVVAVTCLGFRLLNLILFPEYSHERYLFGTHIRVDSLMFGVLLAYLWSFRDLRHRLARIPSLVFVAAGGLLLSPAFLFELETNKWISVFGVILFYVGAGCILLAALRWETTSWTAVRIVAGLGAASYSIYLWHMPVATWGHALVSKVVGFDHFALYLFDAVIGACVFGWLLNRLIENPVLTLRDRLFPSRSLAAASGAKQGASSTSSPPGR